MPLDDDHYMRAAIQVARGNPAAPFGAVLIDPATHETLAVGLNDSKRDPTQHGEIDVLQKAAAAHGRAKIKGATLYTTAEPCPMCMTACVWAEVGRVVYGTSIPHLAATGWRQLDLRASEIADRAGWSTDRVVGGVLAAECDPMFDAAIRSS
ncbi:nucleoside deaminase [Algisphaera agarilytica]|uniref:tRNA(Arg) A34 adenosine deaminase TadA n=1 Tax=Algisphaera agarilytica TaxID=1385975 RepID=A0A7X0H3H7_9BACT|nr:nucleoside deaminase [Algisphaera agarilytica]MBB6428524.1 tRNA(Arg) A34 adenosine deaminase TadA [Algisphaera agarilytica]